MSSLGAEMQFYRSCHKNARECTRSCSSEGSGESSRGYACLPLATKAVRRVLNRTRQAVHQRPQVRTVTCAQAGSKVKNVLPPSSPVCTSVQKNSLGKRRTRCCQSKAQHTSNTVISQDRRTHSDGSNGWAWLLGSLTLSLGTGLPALYVATHFSEVTCLADSCKPFSQLHFVCLMMPSFRVDTYGTDPSNMSLLFICR